MSATVLYRCRYCDELYAPRDGQLIPFHECQPKRRATMKAVINIPKQRGASRVSRNAAILDAVHANTARGLSNSWKIEGGAGDWSEIDAMAAARELRERLSVVCAELRERQHSTFAELEASGLFGWFEVVERRGFWRVECNHL